MKSVVYIVLIVLMASGLTAGNVVFDFEGSGRGVIVDSTAKLSFPEEGNGRALKVEVGASSSYTSGFQEVWNSGVFPMKPGRYVLRAALKLSRGYGMKLELEALNASGGSLGMGTIYVGSTPANNTEWLSMESFLNAWNPECVSGRIRLRVPRHLEQLILLDNIGVTEVPVSNERRQLMSYPVWKNGNPSLFTAGDVVGPDGIVYPDVSYAGAREGRCVLDMEKPHTVMLRDFGGVPGGEIGTALNRAIAALPESGGIVKLEAGEYHLKRFVVVKRDNVGIVGEGAGKTRIICDYDVHGSGIDFYSLSSGAVISTEQPIHVICRPQNNGRPVQLIRLEFDGKEIARFTRRLHSGNYSQLSSRIPGNCDDGVHVLRAWVTYYGLDPVCREIKVKVDRKKRQFLSGQPYVGLICFHGRGAYGEPVKLAKDVKRGERVLHLESAMPDIKPGDVILVQAAETDAFRKRIGNACAWGVSRQVMLTVAGVDGNRIELDQPVRVDYPAVDSAEVRRFSPVKGCGIKGIGFEVVNDFWYHTVSLRNALDCIVRDVEVLKTGRNPVWCENAKFCTIAESRFIDAWNHGGGKSAYVGFERSYDCLMENVETRKMRHAPVVQWSASGNVIRNSLFLNSDAQWHAGWPHENLFENCRIVTDTKKYGAYGHSFFSTGPADTSHGPGGPRNVVYGCDADSMESTVKLTGMNDNWIFVYNRLISKRGDGFFISDGTNDLVLKGNNVLLEGEGRAMLTGAGVDSPGLALIGNCVAGVDAVLFRGFVVPEQDSGNHVTGKVTEMSRPEPPVPSLYDFQKQLKRNRGK